MKARVSIRKIESYDLLSLRHAVAEFLNEQKLAALENAKTVLLKPNLLGAFAPDKAVTTHPIVLEAIIQYLLKRGKEVWLGDSPGGLHRIENVWETTSMSELAKRYPVKLINLSTLGIKEIAFNGFSLKISGVCWEADTVISISKYKTHGLVAFTGAIKNLYGLVPGLIKSEYHKHYPETDQFGSLLNAVHQAVKERICYHFIDGIEGMDGAGPSAGNKKQFNLFFGSASASALDYVAATIFGFKLNQVPYLTEALHQDGILPSAIEYPLSFHNYRLEDIDFRMVYLRSRMLRYIPHLGKVFFQQMFNFYPYITETCKRCGICLHSCPTQAIKQRKDGNFYIQRDNCIQCLCCHEMCPHNAVAIHKSLLAKILIK